MAQAVLPGNPPIDITLRRSARARQISLRVSGLDGKVTLTLPGRVAERQALDFARGKEDWIRRQLARQPEPALIGAGDTLPIVGVAHEVVEAPVRAPRQQGGQLLIPPGPAAGARIEAFLKQHARTALCAASDRHAAALGRSYGRITLRDTRSRWGSCSSSGDLMFSWRLILAPPDVLDYVAAHEVAHLARMDHSPAFWAVVAQLCPGHGAPRAWLRENGATLHRWRFRG